MAQFSKERYFLIFGPIFESSPFCFDNFMYTSIENELNYHNHVSFLLITKITKSMFALNLCYISVLSIR